MAAFLPSGQSQAGRHHTRTRVPQPELDRLAEPFYNRYARGGEGHLEVGKNVYYTIHHLAHMVLALKPFGCMPSTQSDGAQSAVINRYKDMIFLPIETSGEGEVNAHSRVQMALGEAKAKARLEFDQCLKQSGHSLDDIRSYVDDHPELGGHSTKFRTSRESPAQPRSLSFMLENVWTRRQVLPAHPRPEIYRGRRLTGAAYASQIQRRSRRRFDNRQSVHRRCRVRSDRVAGLPAARNQTA